MSITNTWQVSFSELPCHCHHNLNMQKQTPTWHSECSYGSYGSKTLHQGFTSSYPMTPMTLKEVVGKIARCDRCDKHIGRFCSMSYLWHVLWRIGRAFVLRPWGWTGAELPKPKEQPASGSTTTQTKTHLYQNM